MIQSPNLIINNHNFQEYVTDGIDVEYRKDCERNAVEKLWLFDFKEPQKATFQQ